MKMEYFVRNAAILEFIMSVGTGPVMQTYNFLNFFKFVFILFYSDLLPTALFLRCFFNEQAEYCTRNVAISELAHMF